MFHEVNSFTEIMPSIYLTGGIPRTNNFEDAGFGFKTEINGEIVADNISDDSALVIRLPEGLVIISGCAHAGLINTINYCLQQTGCDKVLAYIGGTHLAMASEERIQKPLRRCRHYQLILLPQPIVPVYPGSQKAAGLGQ